MVNLVRISESQIVDEILEPNYFSIYELYALMFATGENDFEECFEMYRALLPFELADDGLLHYPARPSRLSFVRLLWDRHSYFSVVRDFSNRGWIFYMLAEIDWAITDRQVALVWQRIDDDDDNTEEDQCLEGMRARSFYMTE
jgi:hypothetical protein